MEDSKFQFCLLPKEETKAFMDGHGLHAPYKCSREQCVSYDDNKKWCNYYHAYIECKTESEE